MFVPLAKITVHKKSDSVEFDAPYTLQLYKQLWRGKAERVSIERITDPLRNPMREVSGRPGLEPVEQEEERLMKRFGQKTFFMVFPGESFRDVFTKAARDRNEWLEKHEASKAQRLAQARITAATVHLAPSGQQ